MDLAPAPSGTAEPKLGAYGDEAVRPSRREVDEMGKCQQLL